MANYTVTDTELTSIADAIIAKAGLSGQLEFPTDFVNGIEGISTGTDVSDTTATAGDVLSGKYFYTAAGTKTQGSIATKASTDLQVSGATVTAPAGYYSSAASKSVASGSATTPATTITANPSITVNSSGLITATASATQSVTPTVGAGYVSSGTAGIITVSGSNTSQLTTQAAQTITPTTTNQTIASGKYLTGVQTIVGDANLVAGNIKKNTSIFGVTGTYEGSGGGGGSGDGLVYGAESDVWIAVPFTFPSQSQNATITLTGNQALKQIALSTVLTNNSAILIAIGEGYDYFSRGIWCGYTASAGTAKYYGKYQKDGSSFTAKYNMWTSGDSIIIKTVGTYHEAMSSHGTRIYFMFNATATT